MPVLCPTPMSTSRLLPWATTRTPVITNDAAFHQSWNNFTTIGANAGNDTPESWLLRRPTPPTPRHCGTSLVCSSPLPRPSSVKKEAAEFINWFLNSDEANDIMMGERGTPCFRYRS